MASLLSRLTSSRFLLKRSAKRSSAQPFQKTLVTSLLSLVSAARSEGEDSQKLLANALHEAGLQCLEHDRPGEASAALKAALDLGGEHDFLTYNLALAYSQSGQAKAAHRMFVEAQKGDRHDQKGDGYYIRNLYTLDGITLDEIKVRAETWAVRYAPLSTFSDYKILKGPSDPLRVGLISGRFQRHAVGFLTLGGLEHIDQENFELLLYDNSPHEDDYGRRFKNLAQAVYDISAMSDDDAAALIHTHGLHILIDMGGHSAGGRLGVMARKPAPVQIKWAGGQHGTTGLSQIDYFLTDAVETPADGDAAFVETPIRLPNSYAIYTPPPDAPEVNALPSDSHGFITFASFNNVAKISDRTIQAWSRILTQVPHSRLVLKHLALEEEMTRDRVAALFLAYGVAPSQLDMRLPTDQVNHLAAYHDVDITLDPFPWSGCVTTCESLWMGVPVLALPGAAFCHRHSASFLTTVGLSDWIARDDDDYFDKAVSYAAEPADLAQLRAALRVRVQNSPLCDAKQFARDLEHALTTAWDSRS